MSLELPNANAAEEALLGAVLMYPEALDDIEVELGAGDFFVHRHRWVWDAVLTLSRAGQPIDVVTVSGELERHDQLGEVGGVAYLAKLIGDAPSSLNAAAYAAQVAEASERRGLLQVATELAKAAHNPALDLAQVRAEVVSRLVSQQKLVGGAVPIGDVLRALFDEVQARAANPQDIFGIPTGFADFDKITAGLHPTEVLYLAGEPGTGKSLLAAQMAAQMAAAGHPGVIYELEMGSQQLARRTLAGLSGVTTKAMRSGHIGDDQWAGLVQSFNSASEWPLYISDYTGWTTTALRADMARLKQTAGIEWFVLDYFGLLQDSYGKDENEREKLMSGAVKRLCKDMALAGIVVHSMNKQGMGAGVKRLEHISGSGRISFDADVVCFLTKHIPSDGQIEDRNVRTITFAKYREDESNRLLHLVKRPGLPAFGDYVPDPTAGVKASVRRNGVPQP
jgi:replicative DNA helicase